MVDQSPLLQVKNLTVTFGSKRRPFTAVDNVSFDIYRGETFGLVGESGSGKTTIGRAILRANPISSGQIGQIGQIGQVLFDGKEISGRISPQLQKELFRRIQMVFQDPMASLNERAKVEYIVSEGLYSTIRPSNHERQRLVAEALADVGLPPEFAERFPHEFSGGQRQRIGVARSLILNPELIIADEPVSALDVSARAQVLNLLVQLQKRRKLTYFFISHDLSVMRFICKRIAVIYRGRIVELAETERLFTHPLHPYTKALLSAIPLPDPVVERNRVLVSYDPACHGDGQMLWEEVEPEHFVLATPAELEHYRRVTQ